MAATEDKAVLLSLRGEDEEAGRAAARGPLVGELSCDSRVVAAGTTATWWQGWVGTGRAVAVPGHLLLLTAAAVVGAVAGVHMLAPLVAGGARDSGDAGAPEAQSVLALSEQPLEPCGGPCKGAYQCIMTTDYSQCIDCDPEGNYQWDCPTYSNDFRLQAVSVCNLPCDKKPPMLPDGSIYRGGELPQEVMPVCTMGYLEPDYKPERCSKQQDGSFQISCDRPDAKHCGMRFSSAQSTGVGQYTVAMQGAPGPGAATTFYIYTYGRNESRSEPWAAVAFKVFGKQCGEEESKIWTTYSAGNFDEAKALLGRQPWYPKYITVPFNACANWHVYDMNIDQTTVEWMVDSKVYRKENIEDNEFMTKSIEREEFQAHLKVFGQDKSSGKWGDIGFFEDSAEQFPIYAWYANFKTPTQTGF